MARRKALIMASALIASSNLQPAHAAYVAYVYQNGADIVATGSGSLITRGLVYYGNSGGVALGSGLQPRYGRINLGAGLFDIYGIAATNFSFGSALSIPPLTSTGPAVGISTLGSSLLVPQGYVSGTALGPSTFKILNETLAREDLVKGTYVYNLGSGDTQDSFTVKIGINPVPLPASAPLFGAALLALAGFGYAAKRKFAVAA